MNDLTATLRALDPADAHVDLSSNARDTLDRIVSTDPAAASPLPSSSPDGRRRRTRRRVTLATAAVTAATVAVVLPSLNGGDAAYASWTAVPAAVTAAEAAQTAEACRDSLGEGGAGPSRAQQLKAAEPAVAERRGDWTLVLLAGAEGFSGLCITDESTPVFRNMFGSVGTPVGIEAPAVDDVVLHNSGAGAMDDNWLSLAEGEVGADVVGVVVRTETKGDVAATVSSGRFAAWWPGAELKDSRAVALTLSLRDGSTREVTTSL